MVILDEDQRYVSLLTEYAAARQYLGFRAEPFTDKARAEEYLEAHEVKILLIAQKIYMADEQAWRQRCARRDVYLICLADSQQQLWQGRASVRKYQAADSLMKAVMDLYAQQKEHILPSEMEAAKEMTNAKADEQAAGQRPVQWEIDEDVGAKLIGVYSPIGRCGKTSFAVTLGEMLAFHEHVLYLNLEEYSGFADLLDMDGEGDLSDLLYFSRAAEGGLLYKLGSLIHTWEKLDYILPPFFSGDLREIGGEEWCTFLRKLAVEGEYTRIVLDMGTQLDNVFALLKLCTRVYVPVLTDPVSKAKLRQFADNIERVEGQKLAEKLRYLHLPEPGKLEENTDIAFPERIVQGRMGMYVQKLQGSSEKKWL